MPVSLKDNKTTKRSFSPGRPYVVRNIDSGYNYTTICPMANASSVDPRYEKE
jgi:hypothetical protein